MAEGLAVTAAKPRRVPERRIIRRSRLLAALDAVEAQTILLIAPAGYGKTTLSRQWIEHAGGAWVTVTAASADIAVLARDLATALAEVADFDVQRVEAAISAGRTPEEKAQAVGRVILAYIKDPVAGWIVLDDYHLLIGSTVGEELITMLQRSGRFCFVVAARERPAWATARRRVYGETTEFGPTELALDDQEVAELLPEPLRAVELTELARGWPAVIALAAHQRVDITRPVESSATMYEYIADELFGSAAPSVQRLLMALAVLPTIDPVGFSAFVGFKDAVNSVLSTGLAYADKELIQVHPLARDFLVAKLREADPSKQVASAAFEMAVRNECWDDAFRVLDVWGLDDCCERLISCAYLPLLRSGRIATLEKFRRYALARGCVRSVLLDLIGAEVDYLAGSLANAEAHGQAAADRLEEGHPLKARGYFIAGRAALMRLRTVPAKALFTAARTYALASDDVGDAAFGQFLACQALEEDNLTEVLRALEEAPGPGPTGRLRVGIARIHTSLLSFEGGLETADEYLGDWAVATDPAVRSSWAFMRGNVLTLQGNYGEAERILRSTLAELQQFGLSFAIAPVEWSLAAAELGLRHFARCDARLRKIESRPAHADSVFMQLNVRALRARMLLSQQRPEEASFVTRDDFTNPPTRAMYGEYLATRALTLAVLGDGPEAVRNVDHARSLTRSQETWGLSAAALAVIAVGSGHDPHDSLEAFLAFASRSRIWDSVVCASRAAPPLLARLASVSEHRAELADVLLRSHDEKLAKGAGLVSRASGTRRLLSAREREVLDHVRQGRTNPEIAASLYIAPGTVKSHMDHILEKLGARSRAEAVARYAEIEKAETEDSEIS